MFCSSESYLIAFRFSGPSDSNDLVLEIILKKAGCTNLRETLNKIAKSFNILGSSLEMNKNFIIVRATVDVEVTFGYKGLEGYDEESDGIISFLLTFAFPQFIFRASLITTKGDGPEWQKKMLEVVLERKPSKNISIYCE